MPRAIELLSPAKTADIGITAINCGADAVYIGAPRWGARAEAGNSLDDIKRLVDYAHCFGVKVYATVNTIITDAELPDVEQLIWQLYDIGVDALIVQDMAVLMMDLPPIALHASTQCDIRTPEKARFLADSGFSQLVLARELSREEIEAIHSAVNVRLEAFVHGALCVSYSGRCHISQALFGRSANRGNCAQVCRFAFDLIDGDGNVVVEHKHLLSLCDLNRSSDIEMLVNAGVTSFKIEGRLKDVNYVANVTAFYRLQIDRIIAQSEGAFCRSSIGECNIPFSPDLVKSFNRGFTSYFLHNRRPLGQQMASLSTPKSLGEPIGVVAKCRGKQLWIDGNALLHNGDGISYFDLESGELSGFRVNSVEKDGSLMMLEKRVMPIGTPLYRTFDIVFSRNMEKAKASRLIPVDLMLETNSKGVTLTAGINSEVRATVTVTDVAEEAQTTQSARQQATLQKLGGTIFRCDNITTLPAVFIPASVLAAAKRDVIEKLTTLLRQSHQREAVGQRRMATYPEERLSFADNVANSEAERFYKTRGVKEIEPAIEVSHRPITADDTLMTTRYCIRRELGCCLRQSDGQRLKGPLQLRSHDNRFALHFDCKECQMKITRIT